MAYGRILKANLAEFEISGTRVMHAKKLFVMISFFCS